MTGCSVDGCQKAAIAQLLEVQDRGYRCRRCLQYDLDL